MDKGINALKKTEKGPEDLSDLDSGNIRSTGVGLREGEIQALETIGDWLGAELDTESVARNALTRLAVRRFIIAVREGTLPLSELKAYFSKPEKPKPKLDL